MYAIEVRKVKDLIETINLTKDIMTIGRAGNNDIVLPDNKLKVSRYHSALLRNPFDVEGYIIRDLSSYWGTNVSGRHIFQKELTHGDIIHISDFRLKYVTVTQNARIKFQISNELPEIESLIFPPQIGDLKTDTLRLRDSEESLIPSLSKETRTFFEELLYCFQNSLNKEGLLERVLDFLFLAFKMEEGCYGCIAMFRESEELTCLAGKGMKTRMSVTLPRPVIKQMQRGLSVISGKQLWAPICGKDGTYSGFVYLCRNPYDQPFAEDEVQVTSFISQLVGKIYEDKGKEVASEDNRIIQWPRDMIGSDSILQEIERLAPLNVNVLLLGETGVGKGVAAEAIHRHSKRKGGVFRKVHCPAIPKDLEESELFGHVKGAFTGATGDKKGEFELADGGTLFLDEIADLRFGAQSKVLGAIREKVIKRVGEEKTRKADVRILAATNRDVKKEIEENRFRKDLYHSFGEHIFIKPLRERKKDIPLLAHYLLDKYAPEMGLQSRGITPQAMQCLLSYSWPGNTRELENCIKEALSKSEGVICIQHLSLEVQETEKKDNHEGEIQKRKLESLDDTEKTRIAEILQYTRGNKEKAANILRISKPTLYSKIKKYNLPADFGKGG